MSNNRIGILGGTFNPVHEGHLALARSALTDFDLSKVLLIPCSIPAHKSEDELIESGHRLAMLEAACEDDALLEVSDIEIVRGDISYTIDTIGALKDRYPDSELVFIIGSDTLPELHFWKEIHSLLDLCSFGVFMRPGSGPQALALEDVKLDSPWPQRLLESVRTPMLVDVSSSEIRKSVASGESINGLVPPPVESYIQEHNLYSQERNT